MSCTLEKSPCPAVLRSIQGVVLVDGDNEKCVQVGDHLRKREKEQ
jgi:hypothetical protein